MGVYTGALSKLHSERAQVLEETMVRRILGRIAAPCMGQQVLHLPHVCQAMVSGTVCKSTALSRPADRSHREPKSHWTL